MVTKLRHRAPVETPTTSYLVSVWKDAQFRAPKDPVSIQIRANLDALGSLPDFVEDIITRVGERPGPGYILERIDPDRAFFPENLRWVARGEAEERARERKEARALGTKNLPSRRGKVIEPPSPKRPSGRRSSANRS